MKLFAATIILIFFGTALPAIAAYTPPNIGGPNTTDGSGTRLLLRN